jgi:hypothetical protein
MRSRCGSHEEVGMEHIRKEEHVWSTSERRSRYGAHEEGGADGAIKGLGAGMEQLSMEHIRKEEQVWSTLG